MTVKAILLAGAAALSLAACNTPGTDSAAGGPSASNPAGGAQASGRDGCLTGTWNVDVNDMAQQTAAKVGNGATGAGTGTITLVFGNQMTIKYQNVITITSSVNGLPMVMKNTYSGEATSTDWTAKDGKLAGTMPANGVTSKIDMSIAGREVPSTSTPLGGSLNMSDGTLGYTCSGNKATLISPAVTWHLTKA